MHVFLHFLNLQTGKYSRSNFSIASVDNNHSFLFSLHGYTCTLHKMKNNVFMCTKYKIKN